MTSSLRSESKEWTLWRTIVGEVSTDVPRGSSRTVGTDTFVQIQEGRCVSYGDGDDGVSVLCLVSMPWT